MKSRHSQLSLLVAASLLFASQLPVLAGDLPLYCKHRPARGLRPEQEARCTGDPNTEARGKKKSDALQPPTYPFSHAGFLRIEPGSGKQISLRVLSKDGSLITLENTQNKDSLALKPAEIISWKSANAGSGTDTSSAVSTAVVGALFFWPMMLAAPFMIRNYSITSFQIEYIDQYGKDINLDFATIENPKPTMELLQFSTGLTAGARRGLESTRPLYEAGLKQSMLELEALRKPLLVANNQKPWCSTVKLSADQASTAYKSMVEHVSTLRRKLELPPIQDIAAQSADQQWEVYLDSRPGLRQWAATYKRQAETLKKC